MWVLMICFLLCSSLAAAERAPDHLAIDMERTGAVSPPPARSLSDIRHGEVTAFTDELLKEYRAWYAISNGSEMLGYLCNVVSPVLAGIAAATKKSELSTWAMGIGLVGVALSNFSHYASGESRERGNAANHMLVQEGLNPVYLLRNPSLDSVRPTAHRSGGRSSE